MHMYIIYQRYLLKRSRDSSIAYAYTYIILNLYIYTRGVQPASRRRTWVRDDRFSLFRGKRKNVRHSVYNAHNGYII